MFKNYVHMNALNGATLFTPINKLRASSIFLTNQKTKTIKEEDNPLHLFLEIKQNLLQLM